MLDSYFVIPCYNFFNQKMNMWDVRPRLGGSMEEIRSLNISGSIVIKLILFKAIFSYKFTVEKGRCLLDKRQFGLKLAFVVG